MWLCHMRDYIEKSNVSLPIVKFQKASLAPNQNQATVCTTRAPVTVLFRSSLYISLYVEIVDVCMRCDKARTVHATQIGR